MKWTSNELNILKKYYGKLKVFQIRNKIDRSIRAIENKAWILNLKSNISCKGHIKSKKTRMKLGCASKKRWKNKEYKNKLRKILKKVWLNPKVREIRIKRRKEYYRLHPERRDEIADKNTKKTKPLKKNTSFYYILGVILGDGYLYKGNGEYVIGLSVIDLDFIKKFRNNLKLWCGLNAKIKKVKSNTCVKGYEYRMRLYSKKVYDYINRFNKHPIITNKKDKKKNLITGLYDSEGSIYLKKQKYKNENFYWNKNIYFDNTNLNIIHLVASYLKDNGIRHSINSYKMKSGNKCYKIRIASRDGIIQFYNLIRFSIKRKQDKLEKINNILQR